MCTALKAQHGKLHIARMAQPPVLDPPHCQIMERRPKGNSSVGVCGCVDLDTSWCVVLYQGTPLEGLQPGNEDPHSGTGSGHGCVFQIHNLPRRAVLKTNEQRCSLKPGHGLYDLLCQSRISVILVNRFSTLQTTSASEIALVQAWEQCNSPGNANSISGSRVTQSFPYPLHYSSNMFK